jgi:hypothetical protein
MKDVEVGDKRLYELMQRRDKETLKSINVEVES